MFYKFLFLAAFNKWETASPLKRKLGKNIKNIPVIFGISLPDKLRMGSKAEKKQRTKVTGTLLNTKDDDALLCTEQKIEKTNISVDNEENADEEINLKLSQIDDDVDELDEEEEDERNEEK